MSERSVRNWEEGPYPSETKRPRTWRTRLDPFWQSEGWSESSSTPAGRYPRNPPRLKGFRADGVFRRHTLFVGHVPDVEGENHPDFAHPIAPSVAQRG